MSSIYFKKIDLLTAGTPSTNNFVVGYDTDGIIKQKDEFGVITPIGGGLSASYLTATPSLSGVMAIGNETGEFDLIMGDETSIKSNNSTSKIELDHGATNSLLLSSDNTILNLKEGYVELSSFSGSQSLVYEDGVIKLTNSDKSINIGVSEDYDDIKIANNVSSTQSTTDENKLSLFLGARNASFLPGVYNSVILGGQGLTASESNVVYLYKLNINNEYSLPTEDGLGGQALITDGNGDIYWGAASTGLSDTLSVDNNTGIYNIVMGTSSVIKSQTGAEISFDESTPFNIKIKSDSSETSFVEVDNDLELKTDNQLLISATTASIVTDNNQGLVYGFDYSPTFVDNSLITKYFVDQNYLPLIGGTLSGDLTILGDLFVEGTASYINTENLYVEDNIITLNATYSGPEIDSGIEVNLGNGSYSKMIYDASESNWAIGLSGSESVIITEAGDGLTKTGNELSVDFGTVSSINYVDHSLLSATTSIYGDLNSATTSINQEIDDIKSVYATGSGTVNYIPKWESTQGLSSTSSISDDGSQVYIYNGLTVSNDIATENLQVRGGATAGFYLKALDDDGNLVYGELKMDISNVYYVSPTGDDTNAERGNMFKPFETITGARNKVVEEINNATVTGNTLIYVYPGEYNEIEIQYENGNFYFCAGAKVNNLVKDEFDNFLLDEYDLFRIGQPLLYHPDTYSASNCNIYGDGDFFIPENPNVPYSTGGRILTMGSQSVSHFEFNNIESNGTVCIVEDDSNLTIIGNKLDLLTTDYGIAIRGRSIVRGRLNYLEGGSVDNFESAISIGSYTGRTNLDILELFTQDVRYEGLAVYCNNVADGAEININFGTLRIKEQNGSAYPLWITNMSGGIIRFNGTIFSQNGAIKSQFNSGGIIELNADVTSSSYPIGFIASNSLNHTFIYNGNFRLNDPSSVFGGLLMGGSPTTVYINGTIEDISGNGMNYGISSNNGSIINIGDLSIRGVNNSVLNGNSTFNIERSLYVEKELTVANLNGKYQLLNKTSADQLQIRELGTAPSISILGIDIDGNVVGAPTPSTSDYYSTTASLVGNELVIERNDGVTFSADLSTLSTEDNFSTTASLVGNELVIERNDGVTFSADLSTLSTEDNFSTTASLVGNELIIENTDGFTFSADLSTLSTEDNFSTTASLVGNELIIENTDGFTFSTDLTSLDLDYLPLSGGVLTGDLEVLGDLLISGTATFVNTENLYVEDNIITLNATYSGPEIDSGIEVNLGNGSYSKVIYDASESNWALGLSGSESVIITEAGEGLTKTGNELSVDFGTVSSINYVDTSISNLKYTEFNVSLVANTPQTITHNLGTQSIICQAWDSNTGEVVYIPFKNRTTNSVDVESTINITVDIIIQK
jgi:hypothetical protein